MICLKSDKNSAELCAKILLENKVVIIPTDTVYGFSSIVTEDESNSKKIHLIKGRDENKPFIQLIGNPSDIKLYTNDVIPQKLLDLWPGPLTIIVNNKDNTKTLAFRCPNDKWLCSVLNMIKKPLYSTSVNKSDEPILNKIDDIIKEFSFVDLIVDDGNRIDGIASTIVDVTKACVKIVRQGELKIDIN